MDRKGWIILILCSLGLMLTYQLGQDDARNKAKLEQQKRDAEAISVQPDGTTPGAAPADPSTPAKPAPPVVNEETFTLTSQIDGKDAVIYTFTSFGGGVKYAEVLDQKNVYEEGNVKVNIESAYALGSLARSYKDIEKTNYARVSQTKDSVVYQGVLADGTTVTKTWKVIHGKEDSAHKLELNITFKIPEGKTLQLSNYSICTGTAAPLFLKEQKDRKSWFYYEDGDFEHETEGAFSGGWFSGSKKDVVTEKVEALEYIGVNSQFFTITIFPKNNAKGDNVWASYKDIEVPGDDETGKLKTFFMGAELPDNNATGSVNVSYDIYIGTKDRALVTSLSEHSREITNYGLWRWISRFMSWVLNGIHNWFPAGAAWSWGMAIVLLTVFIRIVIWPLHNKSTRTMKRMSKLQPIMKDLKEKHKDNPQKLNQETMKLYREYGVNPLGGCLPMLVQIPIFFGVFRMIAGEVNLRGESFFWVNDLSRPDTLGHFPVVGWAFNLLPFLMVITMVIQMRMTPQTGDKMQRRIMMLMPLMFFFFCYSYASALALYWTTQNIVSIGQTWLTNRMPEPELNKKLRKTKAKGGAGAIDVESDKPRKKGFMERMAEKMEEVHKQQEEAKRAAKPAPKKQVGPKPQKPKKRNPKTGG